MCCRVKMESLGIDEMPGLFLRSRKDKNSNGEKEYVDESK